MQHRGVAFWHGLVFFCISSLFVLGLFVAPAVAQDSGAAAAQYNADGKEVTVIIDTIPDKKVLVDTGGPSWPMIGGVILAVGLVGLGIFLLRRT